MWGRVTNDSPPPTHQLRPDLIIGDCSNWADTALYTDNSRHSHVQLDDGARQLPKTFQQTRAQVEDRHQRFEERSGAVH